MAALEFNGDDANLPKVVEWGNNIEGYGGKVEVPTNVNKIEENLVDGLKGKLNTSNDPWSDILKTINENSQNLYYILKNISKFEDKLDSETEKKIVIKAIERQPWNVLRHWEKFKLLSRKDKEEIAQVFVKRECVNLLVDHIWDQNIDAESKEIFRSVIASHEKAINEGLGWFDNYTGTKPSYDIPPAPVDGETSDSGLGEL